MNVRPLTPDDAETVSAIVRADEEAVQQHPSHLGSDDVRTWWVRLDFERDSWLFEDDGRPLGAGWFHLWGDIGQGVGVVAQGEKGRGIGATLADRYEERARATGARVLRTFLMPEDSAALALFAARGFREVRRFWEMAIELDGSPPQPVVPGGLVIDTVEEDDARAFHAASTEAFADNWDFLAMSFDDWWEVRQGQWADENGPLWFVMRDGDEIAAVIRNEVNRRDGGFVGLLGVRKPWRGRGLGRALLLHSFAEFRRRGLTRATLGVDAENATGATKLYESVGMEIESTNVTYEKTLV